MSLRSALSSLSSVFSLAHASRFFSILPLLFCVIKFLRITLGSTTDAVVVKELTRTDTIAHQQDMLLCLRGRAVTALY